MLQVPVEGAVDQYRELLERYPDLMQRKGRIHVSTAMFAEAHVEVMGQLFTTFMPLRTEYDPDMSRLTLWGVSPNFDALVWVDSLDYAPFYTITICMREDQTRRWYSLEYKRED